MVFRKISKDTKGSFHKITVISLGFRLGIYLDGDAAGRRSTENRFSQSENSSIGHRVKYRTTEMVSAYESSKDSRMIFWR